MNQSTERKNQIISGIWTTIITVALFLIIWFYHFHFEFPPIIDGGSVAVSLGEPDGGGPDEVPVDVSSTPEVPQMPMPDESMEETPDPDAVATKKTPEKSQETAKPVEKPVEKDKTLDELNKSKRTGGGGQTGTKPKGDPNGDPNGDPDGGAGGGPNKTPGGGASHGASVKTSIRGRTLTPKIMENNCNEIGNVILDIICLPDGTIKYDGVNPASSGSACLENLARAMLKQSRFNASATMNSVDGTVTFIFSLK